MKRAMTAIALAALTLSLAAPSVAQTVRDKKSCIQAVADAKEASKAATITAKMRGEIDDMIRISEHLCGEANFVYAETLLAIARGMAAQE